MTLTLRERRRLETARDIQRASLKLARERGLDNLTTEAIADAVGISTRTFFNYYPNKEAACFGEPPRFTEEAKAQLREGTAALPEDLRAFLSLHFEEMAGTEDIIRDIGPLAHENEKLRWLLDEHLRDLAVDLAKCLKTRLPGSSDNVRLEIAKWALQSLGSAIDLWRAKPKQSLNKALNEVWRIKLEAVQLILGTYN
ncbi:TetR family transcriptional regulator [Spongiibacter sp. KMU-158]|uniref:TetR family transcriptional regulator n=1 Tax=Spongiibacter pelagi TaxID=2760804 RepID=A0A927C1A2_9GAMM|nr:TetR/AcrR family transcriptional regulator [Spongiibacter pelagi]MBD2859424.1 TetR family transcriptional regulator [Spongiibacter pelagi]